MGAARWQRARRKIPHCEGDFVYPLGKSRFCYRLNLPEEGGTAELLLLQKKIQKYIAFKRSTKLA